jgi:hypothetical protein
MRHHNSRVDAAKRYALADKSDPFAFSRAMSHMKNGVCGFLNNGQDAFYTADPIQVTRTLPDGTKYAAVEYVNRVRP